MAVQTVYAVFGSKRQLLSDLVDVTIAGDDEHVALPDRPFVAEIAALPDPRAKLARYARHLVEIHARQADVMLALAGAATADPDAAAIWRKNVEERRHGMTMFAAELAATGQLRADRTIETVADVLWLAMDVPTTTGWYASAAGRPSSSSAGTSTPSPPPSSPHQVRADGVPVGSSDGDHRPAGADPGPALRP